MVRISGSPLRPDVFLPAPPPSNPSLSAFVSNSSPAKELYRHARCDFGRRSLPPTLLSPPFMQLPDDLTSNDFLIRLSFDVGWGIRLLLLPSNYNGRTRRFIRPLMIADLLPFQQTVELPFPFLPRSRFSWHWRYTCVRPATFVTRGHRPLQVGRYPFFCLALRRFLPGGKSTFPSPPIVDSAFGFASASLERAGYQPQPVFLQCGPVPARRLSTSQNSAVERTSSFPPS